MTDTMYFSHRWDAMIYQDKLCRIHCQIMTKYVNLD